jgi:Cu/Zn superoxide dismutase
MIGSALASGMRYALLVCAVIIAAAGCQTTKEPEKAPVMPYGVDAPLRPIGSAIVGKIRAIESGDGISLLVSVNNLVEGTYRVAFHTNGNCSSPNGFSAGPLWAPSDSRVPASDLIPSFIMNRDGAINTSAHVKGVHLTGENGLDGRSVIVYQGANIPIIEPGVRNSVVACGVFSPAVPLQF